MGPVESPGCCCPLPQNAESPVIYSRSGDDSAGNCPCPCDGGSCHCSIRNQEQFPALLPHAFPSRIDMPLTTAVALFPSKVLELHRLQPFDVAYHPPPSRASHLLNGVFLC